MMSRRRRRRRRSMSAQKVLNIYRQTGCLFFFCFFFMSADLENSLGRFPTVRAPVGFQRSETEQQWQLWEISPAGQRHNTDEQSGGMLVNLPVFHSCSDFLTFLHRLYKYSWRRWLKRQMEWQPSPSPHQRLQKHPPFTRALRPCSL